MNNSKLIIDNLNSTLEPEISKIPHLRERESELVKLIDVITRINSNSDWLTLKPLLFESELASIEKKLKNESERDILNPSRIHQLQGEQRLAKKYKDLGLESYRKELQNVRSQLKTNQ